MFESAMRNDRSPKLVSGQCLVRSESSANFMRFIELLFQGDLLQLEKLIVSMGDRDDSLLEIVNEVSKRHDSPEFRCYARRLAWKEGTISKVSSCNRVQTCNALVDCCIFLVHRNYAARFASIFSIRQSEIHLNHLQL